jgi:hypothetical protein
MAENNENGITPDVQRLLNEAKFAGLDVQKVAKEAGITLPVDYDGSQNAGVGSKPLFEQEQKPEAVETPAKKPVGRPKKVETIDTPLYKSTVSVESEGEIDVNETLANLDVLSNYGKNYGFDIKNPDDLKTVFSEVEKLRGTSEELTKKEQELAFYKNYFASLPPEIAKVLSAYNDKKDYRSEMKSVATNPFDFNKSFGAYRATEHKTFVDHYFPNQYTDESWEELDPKVQNAVIGAAETKYESDRQNFNTSKFDYSQKVDAYQNSLKTSIEESILEYRKGNPTIGEKEVEEIRKQMYGGLNQKLYTQEGTFRKEAAEVIAYATFGKQTVEALGKAAERKLEAAIRETTGKVNEDIVTRYSDKVPQGHGGGEQNEIEKIIQTQTGFLKRGKLFQD